MSDATTQRVVFATGFGIIMTTAGAAIGLGNIWRFPYMMGQSGGSAFLLLYLVFVIAFGVPGLMAECALGRHTRCGPVGAFQAVSMPGAKLWSVLIVLTMIMAGSYYGVVLADVLAWGVTMAAAPAPPDGPALIFGGGTAVRLGGLVVTLAITGAALGLGLRRGIERLSTIVLPVFVVVFVALIVYVLRQDGAVEGLRGFLVPRWNNLTPANAVAALGQAFFSLGLAGSLMVMYGSHLRRDDSIPSIAVGTAAADVGAGLMACLIVVPSVLVLGKEMAGGPALLFQVMPEVFSGMPMGRLVGVAFFGAVFLIAVLSLIAAFEVVIGAAVDRLGWSRPRAVAVLCGLELVLGVPALVSNDYIGFSDQIWGNTMMPLGSALAVVALAWFAGRAKVLQEIGRHSKMPMAPFLFFWLKYVVPLGIVATLVYGWIDWVTSA